MTHSSHIVIQNITFQPEEALKTQPKILQLPVHYVSPHLMLVMCDACDVDLL